MDLLLGPSMLKYATKGCSNMQKLKMSTLGACKYVKTIGVEIYNWMNVSIVTWTCFQIYKNNN